MRVFWFYLILVFPEGRLGELQNYGLRDYILSLALRLEPLFKGAVVIIVFANCQVDKFRMTNVPGTVIGAGWGIVTTLSGS